MWNDEEYEGMRHKRYKTIIKYIPLFLLWACDEGGSVDEGPDTQVPVIQVVSSSPEAKEGVICGSEESYVIRVATGNEIILNLAFSDDRNLSQYKIDVHNNFDCHAHGRITSSWQVLKIENVVGKKVELDEVLAVPENALAGDYHLQILCIDESGNEAEPILYSIQVENSIDNIPPELMLSEPSSNSFTVAKGSEIKFQGMAKDNHSLGTGRIEITYTDPEGAEFSPIQQIFPDSQDEEATVDLTFKVPDFAISGKHQFVIRVHDRYNNFVEKAYTIDFQ